MKRQYETFCFYCGKGIIKNKHIILLESDITKYKAVNGEWFEFPERGIFPVHIRCLKRICPKPIPMFFPVKIYNVYLLETAMSISNFINCYDKSYKKCNYCGHSYCHSFLTRIAKSAFACRNCIRLNPDLLENYKENNNE